MAKTARTAKKRQSMGTTAKSLARNFGRLAVDVQRIALMEMVKVYENATRPAKAKKKKKALARKSPTKKRKPAKARKRATASAT